MHTNTTVTGYYREDGTITAMRGEEDYFRVQAKKVVVATPEMSVDQCMAMMTEKRIRHLPVVDAEGQLTGVISIGDLVKFVSAEQETMIKNLEKYIEGSL